MVHFGSSFVLEKRGTGEKTSMMTPKSAKKDSGKEVGHRALAAHGDQQWRRTLSEAHGVTHAGAGDRLILKKAVTLREVCAGAVYCLEDHGLQETHASWRSPWRTAPCARDTAVLQRSMRHFPPEEEEVAEKT